MNSTEARANLELKLAQRGIVGEAVDEEISKIVKAIPELMRDNYDADDTVAAAQYVDKYFAKMDGEVAPTAQTPKAPAVGGTPEISIPAAEMKNITSFMNATRASRMEKAQHTKITRVVGDKPYPGTYLHAGTTMIPHADETKFAAYEEKLVDTPENREAYKKCMDAIKSKSPMEIYIPEEGKWSPRTVGIEVTTPGETGSAEVTKTLDTDQAVSFVACELAGYITCDANGIGAKLASVRVKKSAKASASQSPLSPRLNIVNRKHAYEDANMHVFASKVKKNGNEVVTKEGNVRSALSFQIRTGKTDSQGREKTRTVRVPGRTNIPRWERTTPAYEEIFGPAEKQSNVVTAPTASERKAMDQILSRTLYAIQNDASTFGNASYQLEQELQKVSAAQPASAQADFA